MMKVGDIIKKVRWCVDEESGFSDYEDVYFDNIVKSSIGASLRWCALYADAVMLTDGQGSVNTSLSTDYNLTIGEVASTPPGITYEDKYIVLPSETIRIARIRVDTWHKGISNFIAEDSDQYLMQYDETSKATTDRPVACVVQTNPLKVELFPKPSNGDKVEVSLIKTPSDINTEDYDEDSEEINIPVKLEMAFIYYLAYLVMCAHSDTTKASHMLDIAKQQIAIREK